jgi:inorganic pyrophosphatase
LLEIKCFILFFVSINIICKKKEKKVNSIENIWKLFGLRYKSHPWHGVSIGENAPDTVTTYIECVPTDTVKYEVDKESGYLKVDRPQKFSNVIPALYGFIPRTYCGDEVAVLCNERNWRTDIVGDGDPVDICVLTERNITHGDILVQAVPIGGFRMIDGNEADDKIIAVMLQDEIYKDWKDIADCPPSIIDRLRHYFLTYKDMPGHTRKCEITHTYGREEALEVIRRSQKDYAKTFGDIEKRMSSATFDMFDLGKKIANKK